MTAVFPCYPSVWTVLGQDSENPRVVLDIMRVIGDSWDGEGWQAFEILRECPTLWRGGDPATWRTHAEIRRELPADHKEGTTDSCVVCDVKASV